MEMNAEADEIFQTGMNVTVQGEMTGENFGTPILRAQSVTATEAPATR
jgi:hypothetical protein